MKNINKYRLTNLKGILMDSEFSWTFSEGEFSWTLSVNSSGHFDVDNK